MKKQDSPHTYLNLSYPLTGRFVGQTVLGFLFIHMMIWAIFAYMYSMEWNTLLGHWDSRWYSKIIEEGYTNKSVAFYPLYPTLVKGIHWMLGGEIPLPILGTLLSTLLFLAFCCSLFSSFVAAPLRPETRLGWLLFLCWPGSMIFHSHHTESLFLLLAFWTFLFVQRQRWAWASILAGLCALTRPHGVLVGIVVGCWVAMDIPAAYYGRRLRRLVVSGCISGSLFALFPLYQWFHLGDPWLFVKAQSYWAHSSSWREYVATFFFLSRSCLFTYMQVTHYVFFLGFWVWFVYFHRKYPFFALYLFLVLMLIPAQCSVINTFRFGAVLFPVLFVAGDWVARLPQRNVGFLLLGYFVIHNLIITINYAMGSWSY